MYLMQVIVIIIVSEYSMCSQVDVSSLTADQSSVREAVHSLLISLCTSVRLGVVFHDKSFGSTKQ